MAPESAAWSGVASVSSVGAMRGAGGLWRGDHSCAPDVGGVRARRGRPGVMLGVGRGNASVCRGDVMCSVVCR